MMHGRRLTGRGAAGFTLTEILVALSLFMVLGSMLVLALRSGVDTWRATEERRVVYEQANLVLRQIESDLANAAVPRPGDEGAVGVRLLCDLDANRRYRLRFVRTLKDAMADDALRRSGTGSPEAFPDDLDSAGTEGKNLKPLGGLMEVAYVFDPDPRSNVLYRGVRSPVGGKDSLFEDENLNSADKVRARCTPVADGVLYLGLRFWTQFTTTWDLQTGLSDQLGTPCGPEVLWDSTRAVLPHPKDPEARKNPNVFWLAAGTASVGDPSDDVFPRQIQIHLCVTTEGGGPRATLLEDLDRKDTTISVDSAGGFATEDDPDLFRYVKIDTEWIYYESRSPFTFETRIQARGARGTRATDHATGAEVLGGRTFVTTVKLPAHQGHWMGDQMSKLLSRHAPPDPPWVKGAGRVAPGRKK